MVEISFLRALRESLSRHFPNDRRTVSAFEQLFDNVESNGSQAASAAEATVALRDATVIVLSANEAFTNERILKLDPGLVANDDGEFVTISLEDVARSQNYAVLLVAQGDTTLDLPLAGLVLVKEAIGQQVYGNFVNDAAAAGGGVPVDGLYRNGSILMVRVA